MINNLARSRKCQETWNKSFIPTDLTNKLLVTCWRDFSKLLPQALFAPNGEGRVPLPDPQRGRRCSGAWLGIFCKIFELIALWFDNIVPKSVILSDFCRIAPVAERSISTYCWPPWRLLAEPGSSMGHPAEQILSNLYSAPLFLFFLSPKWGSLSCHHHAWGPWLAKRDWLPSTEPTQVEVELLPQQGAHFHPRQGYSAVQKYASMLWWTKHIWRYAMRKSMNVVHVILFQKRNIFEDTHGKIARRPIWHIEKEHEKNIWMLCMWFN